MAPEIEILRLGAFAEGFNFSANVSGKRIAELEGHINEYKSIITDLLNTLDEQAAKLESYVK